MSVNWILLRGLFFAGILVLCWGSACAEDRGPESGGPFAGKLTVTHGAVSADYHDAPLGEVLKELTRQAGIEVTWSGAATVADKVSAKFNDFPVTEAIQRILKGKNYTLIYAQDSTAGGDTSGPRVVAINVVSNRAESRDSSKPGGTHEVTPPGSPKGRSVEELAQEVVQAPEPAKRIAALKTLGDDLQQENTKILPTVTSALKDKDPEVRKAALHFVGTRGMAVSDETLRDLAVNDPNRDIRIRVLDELVDRSDADAAVEYLKQALRDPDPSVQAQAQRMLNRVAAQEAAEGTGADEPK